MVTDRPINRHTAWRRFWTGDRRYNAEAFGAVDMTKLEENVAAIKYILWVICFLLGIIAGRLL